MANQRPTVVSTYVGVLAAVTLVSAAGLARAADGHPFILWTKEEAAALRKKIETEAWARRAYEDLPPGGERGTDALPNLVRYGVMGNRAAGELEKKALLGGRGNRLMQAVRYDVLYDLLSPTERERVEKALRADVERAIEAPNPYNRFNWLPNITYVWVRDLHVAALALRDERLARRIFECPLGFKWYLDEYTPDMGFYNEEFGKQFVRAGAMMLWVRAADRMGMEEIGSGYVGRQGATFRGYVEGLLRLGMPAVDLGTARPHIPRLTMGDAKGSHGVPAYGFQHNLVPGWLKDRPASRMGPYRGGHLPQWVWFEIAHKKWPEAGFGYMLAMRRAPDEERYYPTLYFGLDPIDPETVARPPGVSGVYPGRGLIVLRAERGPDYWTSPAPAVGMRLATPYAHHVQDCFALTGFYGLNRPLLINRQHSTGYSGVDPSYSNSSRSHSTVLVDFAEPKTIGEVSTRHHLGTLAKFAAARGYGIFGGVDQTRALVVTRDCLLDVFHLASDRPRHYQWFVQAIGNACPDGPAAWAPSHDLAGSLFDVARERSIETDETWGVTVVQSSGGANRDFSGLGDRWFEERIGVRTTMLGEAGTTAYTAWSPTVPNASGLWAGRDRFAYGEDEPAGALIAAIRKKPETTFIAVHEPIDGHRRIQAVERVGSTRDAFVVAVHTPEFTDYVALRLGENAEEECTVSSGREQFTFTSYAFVRVTTDRVAVEGALRSMRVWVDQAKPTLTVDRREAECRVHEGYLRYPRDASFAVEAGPRKAFEAPRPVISARWLGRQSLCLPLGGQRKATLRLRNNTDLTARLDVQLEGPKGLSISPAAVELRDFLPGAERDVEIAFDAAHAPANRLLRVSLTCRTSARFEVEPAPLAVANGMWVEHAQRHWGDPSKTIYSPRYVARVHYMDSGAASLLLDPKGYRRTGSDDTSWPNLVRYGTDDRGREGWHAEKVRKFPYFIPVVVPGEGDEPPLIYEAGRHAHGTTSSVEHWFTEDWIVVRYRNAKPGERIAFDWAPSSRKNSLEDSIVGRRADRMFEKAPGRILVATPDGQVRDATEVDERRQQIKLRLPKGVEEIAAVFDRPSGYEYGRATFYPPGSRREGRYVTQPGGEPMGFTFSTEAEFPGQVKKWLADTPSGDARPVETGTYNGAFMPHLEPPP